MSTLDLTTDGPLTLESLMLSRQIAAEHGVRITEVLLTLEQQMDIYTEMQHQVRFVTPSGADSGMRWCGIKLRVKDDE